jgi:hypothetical protein
MYIAGAGSIHTIARGCAAINTPTDTGRSAQACPAAASRKSILTIAKAQAHLAAAQAAIRKLPRLSSHKARRWGKQYTPRRRPHAWC